MLAIATGRYDACGFQNRQMLRDVGFRHAERVLEAGNGVLAFRQEIKNPKPCRAGECLPAAHPPFVDLSSSTFFGGAVIEFLVLPLYGWRIGTIVGMWASARSDDARCLLDGKQSGTPSVIASLRL